MISHSDKAVDAGLFRKSLEKKMPVASSAAIESGGSVLPTLSADGAVLIYAPFAGISMHQAKNPLPRSNRDGAVTVWNVPRQ